MAFILFILAILLLIFFFIDTINKYQLIKFFNSNNVIVFGKKGTGKDLIFNFITSKKNKYYSNIPYTNQNYELFTLSDLKLGDNTFENTLNDNIIKSQWKFDEKTDFFISDCGIYLPSQYDYILHKKYSGLPLFYALSRHIGNHNVHCNVQSLERIWKPLREQADIYIKTLKTFKLPLFLVVKYRVYDKYSSATNDIRPVKEKLLKKDSQIKIQNANVGIIFEKTIFLFKPFIRYNSHYFKEKFITSEFDSQ